MQYGFENIGRTKGELFLGKAFTPRILKTPIPYESLQYHRQYYPAFLNNERVQKFLVPIKAEYYSTLFPENVNNRQAGLFDQMGLLESKIPGNTIRKVYVCHATTNAIKEGDILLFFHLKSDLSLHSQSLITIGIVDGFDVTKNHDRLLQLTAKRSVFSSSELIRFTNNGLKKVKVINFLLAGHINPAIISSTLENVGIKGPYQSIRKITHNHFLQLRQDIKLDVKTT